MQAPSSSSPHSASPTGQALRCCGNGPLPWYCPWSWPRCWRLVCWRWPHFHWIPELLAAQLRSALWKAAGLLLMAVLVVLVISWGIAQRRASIHALTLAVQRLGKGALQLALDGRDNPLWHRDPGSIQVGKFQCRTGVRALGRTSIELPRKRKSWNPPTYHAYAAGRGQPRSASAVVCP